MAPPTAATAPRPPGGPAPEAARPAGVPTRLAPRLAHISGLDGLRALAVSAVIAYHAELDWLPGGFLGVEVFFVISGYLITSLLLREHRATGRLDLRAFWLRRARRLLPALFALLAASAIWSVIFLPDTIGRLRADVLAALTYVTNWWLVIGEWSYFEAAGRPPLLQHLWSLAVEEQFYLLWPLLLTGMLRLWGGRRRPVLVATCTGVALSTLAMVLPAILRGYPLEADPSRVYYGTDTRAAGLLVGAALAMVWSPWRLSRHVPSRARMALDAAGVAGLAGLAWLLWRVSEFSELLYRGGFLLCALATALVIAVAAHPAGHIGPLLDRQPLRWIGERSYGLYLWHFPIFAVTRPQLDIPVDGAANLALRLALTVAVAECSYRYVEQPVRHGRLGAHLRALRTAPAAQRPELWARTARVGGVVALVATLAVVGLTSGRPAPLPPGFDARAASADVVPGTAATPATAPGSRPAGPAAPPAPAPGVPRVTAIGDSVMLGAKAALEQRFGGDIHVDAAVSRQFGTAIDILRAMRDQGRLSPTVVVHMGTNGVITHEQFDALMAVLADRPRVVIVNLKVPRRWEAPDNAVLADGARRHRNTVLLDWHAVGSSRPDIFWTDGYHLRPHGAQLYAELIAQHTEP